MLNNIFPLPIQAACQPDGPGDTSPTGVVSPFESSSLWIDDEQFWWLALNF